ncbi:MAG: DNA starvation/stationary phase protection protein [Acholeplasmataceae bacterium]|jgi:starvation-inducible DNA-binding protein|nr:DNA starvation/stationary phase protection protein [Acholeplasmataceae bacterium]MCK9233554.1 DNA starvation/stationary phase protection protein [Acholeplasmataceae bacterium]MCK9288802.1 DNA starvation/stationary phase protection protein [Acholeplasmataceae bacterium]MCK9427292.1 DNA starvation/stationary phase protection protein [Acholeplasmataceae bacterium]MDD4090325.1 DNA starvation/stationary phase protection protein [Acholeplasmataceae bacterium]
MKLEKLMNEQVANLIVFYVKLHNYHWFVKGNQFYRLHELLDDMYVEITNVYDEVAERMLMLEMKPVATIKESLALATIKEATGKETTVEMVENVLSDYRYLDERFKAVLDAAEAIEDDVTADLMTTVRADFQKHIWMLREWLK